MVSDGVLAASRTVAALLEQMDSGPEMLEATPTERAVFHEAATAVRGGGAELLDRATPHLWEYHDDVCWIVDGVVRGEAVVPRDGDIWEFVSFPWPPTPVLGGRPLAPSPCYLVFSGDAAWQPELGLQLVLDHDGVVVRVCPYDGHPTLAAVRGDPALLGEVYG